MHTLAQKRDSRLEQVLDETAAEVQASDADYFDIFARKVAASNLRLIRYYSNYGNKIEDTMQLLDPPESIEQQELEQSLKVIFKRLMVDNKSCENYLANTKEIQEGYSLLIDVFRTGGF